MKNPLKIKICGVKEGHIIDFINHYPIAFIGFIFVKNSPRYITPKAAQIISQSLAKNIKKVAVTANASAAECELIRRDFKPDLWQFHGQEDDLLIEHIRQQMPVIRALPLASKKDLSKLDELAQNSDYLLFDSKLEGQKIHGGTGQSFDWRLLDQLSLNSQWFLSGGLAIDNITAALKQTKAKMIDISSGLESKKGVKEQAKIKQFIEFLQESYELNYA